MNRARSMRIGAVATLAAAVVGLGAGCGSEDVTNALEEAADRVSTSFADVRAQAESELAKLKAEFGPKVDAAVEEAKKALSDAKASVEDAAKKSEAEAEDALNASKAQIQKAEAELQELGDRVGEKGRAAIDQAKAELAKVRQDVEDSINAK